MEIEYLQKLVEYPARWPNDEGYRGEIISLSLDEIVILEATYNNGNVFPKALRELLYLAGDFCYLLEWNAWSPEEEMYQISLQNSIVRYIENMGLNITRPFMGIDLAYPGNFRIVYLDEGDDPIVYAADEKNNTIEPSDKTLSQLINHIIKFTHRLF